MAAWSDDMNWAPERYDRLEALIDCVAAGWYEEWDALEDLQADDPTKGRCEMGDDQPAAWRPAA